MMTPYRSGLCILVTGSILFLFGLIFGLVMQGKVDDGLKEVSQVCGSKDDSFESWRSNEGSDSPPKYKYYYAFNATNVAKYLGQTPTHPEDLELNVVGPYALRQYDVKFDIEFSDAMDTATFKEWERLEFTKSRSCEGCDNTDRATNLNPGFLKALTAVGSEYLIGLGLSNADITYAKAPPCNATTIPHSMTSPCDPATDPLCCCNSNATLPATDRTTCKARASGIMAEFAKYDNGVEFVSPQLQAKTYSPLFINKNVHEAAYGYPSALLGLLGGVQAAQKRDVTALTALARYSGLVYAACNNQAEGIAPSQDALKGTPIEFLNLITCSPVNAASYWFKPIIPAGPTTISRCKAMTQNPLFTAACTCIDPNAGVNRTATVEKPCCTQLGLGCFAQVTGYVTDEQYITEDQSRTRYTASGTKSNTGCGKYKEGEEFWWTEYEKTDTKYIWAKQSRADYTSPSQPDMISIQQDPTQFTYVAKVKGSDGTRFAGVGKQSSFLSSQLNDGKPKVNDLGVFITQVQRVASVHYTQTEKYLGVNVARFEPSDDLLSQQALAPFTNVDNGVVGAGTPYSGMQDVTYLVGFPAYVSMPLFYNGDAAARTNGIKITVDGETPDVTRESYGTFFLVEPSSGMTVFAHKRLQASFGIYKCTDPRKQLCNPQLCPNNACAVTSLLSPFVPGGKVIPQYWMDETAAAEEKQMSNIKTVMSIALAADAILLVLPLVGALLIAFGGYRVHLARRSGPSIDKRALLEDPSV